MALNAIDFLNQMIAQGRILDPSMSFEVGTPERKLITPVAQSLADNQVDVTGLSSALDITAKFGTALDQFVSMFSMQRQQAIAATGYVVFSRLTAATTNILIPAGVTLQASTSSESSTLLQYITTAGTSIPYGATESTATPVQCVMTGTGGNTAANTITQMVGSNVPGGVTAVTNPNALTNGQDVETDDALKVRFRNTWARNLAGTEDQYLALALAGISTKANVLGVVSRFQEYIQIPPHDDAGNLNGVNDPTENTYGTAGYWTTALSSIPYAKQVYTNEQVFISSSAAAGFFYRPNVDFLFNMPAVMTGDVLRSTVSASILSTTTGPPFKIQVVLNAGFTYQQLPETGVLWVRNRFLAYNARSIQLDIDPDGSHVEFTLVNPPPITLSINEIVYEVSDFLAASGNQPNFTFLNASLTNAQGIIPNAVMLSEFSYISSASRNDMDHQIDNAVDVYVDGDNPVQASTIFHATTTDQFVTDPTSPWYFENYRRSGQAAKRPQINHYITPLFQAPVDDLPDSIVLNNQTYYEGWHYWLVHEIGDLSGSIRARDGIEWHPTLGGDVGSGPPTDVTKPYAPTGDSLTTLINNGTALEIDNYNYDANIVTLQAALDNAAQVTTDPLAHRAKIRYFSLDVTIVYSAGSSPSAVNVLIQSAVQSYLQRQYFGSIIQLSTLLEIIHEVPGVENVRWSTDFPNQPTSTRVTEVDVDGNPLHGASIDRLFYGTNTSHEVQTLYIVGNPDGATFQIGTTSGVADSFVLTWNDTVTHAQFTTGPTSGDPTVTPISFWNLSTGLPVSANDIQGAINTAIGGAGLTGAAATLYGTGSGITVTEDTRPLANVSAPIRSFSITYPANGTPVLPTVTQTISSSNYVFNEDFYLLDNELPSLPVATADKPLAGLNVRVRAQNTFFRAG